MVSVEVRGLPLRRIFSWARWGWGPGQIPVVRTSASSSSDVPQKCNMEIDGESYLEQRLGIIIGADRHGLLPRILSKHMTVLKHMCFPQTGFASWRIYTDFSKRYICYFILFFEKYVASWGLHQ